MVTLTRKTNTVEIVFSGSSTYLYDGKISAPLGSLVLIVDQSDMATVRRAPSFDILFSAKIADMEFGGTQATKANINDLFNATCGGNSGGGGGGDMSNYYTKQETDAALSGKQDTLSAGSGVSISGNVISVTAASPDMSNYWTSAQTEAAISAATSGKADASDVYTKQEIDQANRVVSEALHELHDEKADTSAVTAAISAATSGKANSSDVYTKTEMDTALSGKQNTLTAGSGVSISGNVISVTGVTPDMSNYWTSAQTEAAISAATSGKADASDVYSKTEIDQSSRVVSEALHELHDEKADTSAMTAAISAATSGKANSSDVYTKTEMDTALSGKQNTLTAGSGVSISGDTISVTGGGTNVVTLTQAQYDALATKDPGTIYVISDAPSAYYAKTDVDNVPTSGSTNLLTSGTLYDVLGDIDTALTNIIGGN